MAHHTSVPVEPVLKQNSSNTEYTLYVGNLPDELNKDGITEIFNYYGNVTGLFYRRNTNWAYVTYASYNEAEGAIRDLHDVPPLRLKVSFARKNKLAQPQCKEESISQCDTTEAKNPITKKVAPVCNLQAPGVGRGNVLSTIQKTLSTSKFPLQQNTSKDVFSSTCPSDLQNTERADPYNSTNTLWTRGHVTITEDGKRHVSLGRGYTLCEIPEPYNEVQEDINKVHEKRCVGLYEYGKNEVQHMIGKCQKCTKITQYTCKRCATFYCSRSCQLDDWPQHKTACENIPALIPAVNTMSLSESKTVEQTPVQNASGTQLPLRRPKKFIDVGRPVDQDDSRISKEDKSVDPFGPMNASVTKLRHPNTKTIHRSNSTPKGKTECTADVSQTQRLKKQNSEISSLTKMSCNGINDNSLREETQSTVKNSKYCNQDVTEIEEDIAFSKRAILSKTKYTDIRIMEKLNNREYWIQIIDYDHDLQELMITLQTANRQGLKVKPVVNNIYAVQYETLWHRALVLSTDPLVVNYIDYGNNETITTDDIRDVGELKSIPRFTHKIRLSEKANEAYKNLKYDDQLSVKMISVDSNGVFSVEVKGEDELRPSQTNANETPTISNGPTNSASPVKTTPAKFAPKVQSVTSKVSVGSAGFVDVHIVLNNNTYNITLLPDNLTDDFSKLLAEFQTMCTNREALNFRFEINVGDLVCGKRSDGEWYRGYIVSLEPMKMAFIDEATVMPISKAFPLPEPFSKIVAFGAQCKVTDDKYKLEASDQYRYEVVGCKTDGDQTEIEIEITKDSNKLKAVVVPWNPAAERIRISFAQLKSGSEVSVMSYKSHTHLYVRSLSTADEAYYNNVMQSVAKCAQTASFLTKPPAIGEIVIGHYLDGNYYRALVTNTQDEKVEILYVDFGNTEIIDIKANKLKVLSDDLKQLRSCVAKVILKDVPQDVPMTKEISDYLNYLVGKEVHLICKFEGVPFQDGVHLSLRSGENVNDKINELLVPSWKKPDEEDKACFMEQDINIVTLGKAGDVMEAFILHSMKDGHKYAMCPVDADLMVHICGTMSDQMKAYCETNDYYIPRDKELCLARYEGQWYRALCMCRKETPVTSTIFFLDFGNIGSVDHTEIRLMPKEFMTPDCLATICTVINLAPTDKEGEYSSQVQKRISELIVSNSHINIKIVNANAETAEYDIELPGIRGKLIDEGLL